MMKPARYTPFPDLCSSPIRHGHDPAQRSTSLLVEAPHDVLVIAWAMLLRSYTEDVTPTFKVHARSVTVDTSDWTLPIVNYITTTEGERLTGVVSPEEPRGDGFDLFLCCEENKPQASLGCSSRIPSAHLIRIAEQLVYIVHQRLELQGAKFSWHGISQSELSIVNRAPRKLEGPGLLHQLLERHIDSTACALEFRCLDGEYQTFSYAELHQKSDRLAVQISASLQSSMPEGGSVREIVPLLIPQCVELYIAILAILKAGAAFCPLHLDAPVERTKFIVEDVAARLIITTSELRSKLVWDECPAIILADISGGCDDSDCGPPNTCKPTNLAYVMYTSGSTGQPKGVGISHLSASQALLAHDKHIPTFHRFLQFAAPTFDVFVFEMFFPLYRGRTLVGCNRTELLSDLPAMINTLNVDAVELTPTVAGTLIQKRSSVPTVKVLLTIGEMLTRPVVEEFGDSFSREGILHGMYGPTEATIHCTLATRFSSQFKVGIIGVPLDTVSCLIIAPLAPRDLVPRALQILPVGHVGELAIAGTQLADGYINRPEQTSSAFLEDPLYGRIYRTGDKARLLPDGNLECLGRISAGQVKLRGQRIELGEIEQVAYRTEGIRSATAAVIGGIVVLFCASNDETLTSGDLLESCRRWLPGFVVPGDIILLKDVPRLPSGKVDVLKLKAEYAQEKNGLETANPRQLNLTESEVSGAVQAVLGLKIDPLANLTAAGLDSLSAIRLASKLRSADMNISVVDILKANTIQGMAQSLQTVKSVSLTQESMISTCSWEKIRKNALNELERIPVVRDIDIHDIIPCTPLQIAMLSETKINHHAYCNWIELECLTVLNFEEVQAAFVDLANQNEILRTGFAQPSDLSHPFIQIIWSALPKSQVSQAESLTKGFKLETTDEFLMPLRVQVRDFGVKTRMLVQIHHALYDGWSWEHMVGDLDLILRKQSTVARPQYRNIVNFYRQPSATSRSSLSREYWRIHLQDASSCTLPNLHGRKDIKPSLQVVRILMSTPPAEVELASRSLGVSSQSLFQAAFAWLLSVYIGSSEVIFGTVSSGRTLPVTGIEDIMGPCIATLPVRLDVGHSRTAQDLIQRVHRLSRQLLENHELSLREIKKTCGIDPGKFLFDSVLVWQQTLQERRPEILTQVDATDQLEFNLTLEVELGEKAYVVKANYQRAIFPEVQADLFLRQIDQLVAALTHDPSILIADFGYYLDEEILSIENRNPEQYQSATCLTRSIEVFAQEQPNLTALEFAREIGESAIEVERISYNSLNNKANQLAHYLLKQNVSPNDLVCICMEKSVDLYIGILGIIKTGAGYLPITPETPEKRRDNILTESKVKVCLSHSALVERGNELFGTLGNEIHEKDDSSISIVPEANQAKQNRLRFPLSVRTVYVDEIDLKSMPKWNPKSDYRPSDLAYAVFTSGTTGVAKGVLVTQGNLASNLRVLSDIYPVKKGSRLLQSCSQAFDVSVFEIFFTWYTGMCLCSASQNVLFRDLENAIRAMRITHLSLTPTVAALVKPNNVPEVKFLVTAGEPLTAKVFKCWSGNGLFQGYGPSETTNICTVKPFVTASDNINNIGPPLRNTSAFVMQGPENLALTPRGGVGEFCFGGDQVFRGYLDRPSLNSQKIADHPKFGRLYRSGDYGRILWDGSLECHGRQDDQVKIRGQRVELGEISNVLLRSPDVIDVVTIIDDAKATAQRILTFWVPKNNSSSKWQLLGDQEAKVPILAGLFSDLLSLLPAYMIPSVLVPMSCIPITAQGKVDKRRLIRAVSSAGRDYIKYCSRPTMHGPDHEEWTALERKISNILCTIIECVEVDVGRHTSFFSLGLDSISAVSFSKYLREQGFHGAEASIILRNPTISALGKQLTQSPRSHSVDKAPKINICEIFDQMETDRIRGRFDRPVGTILKILPCTPLQEAMLSSLSSQTTRSYYNHTFFEIHGDLGRLHEAWQQMVSKHDILRTSFTTTENGRQSFAQIVFSSHQADWKTFKVSNQDLDIAVEQRMDDVARSSNPLDPPYSFAVFQSTNKKFLLLSMHHALYDGEAMQLLLSEATGAYDGHDTSPAVSFEPFLEQVLSIDLEEADLFWSKQFNGFSPKLFSRFSRGLPADKIKNSDTLITSFSSSVSLQAVEFFCKKHSLSLLGMAQSSWAKLLSLYLGTADFCFGNVVSGRTLPMDGIDRLVAPCFNTLPMRCQLTSNMSNMDLFKNIQQCNFDALPYQFTPLRHIQRTQSSGGQRLFDTLFILQKPQHSFDNHIWSIKNDVGAMDLPLVCEIIPSRDKDSLRLNLHTHNDFELHGYASIILKTLDAIMQACLEFPSSLVTDFGFLDEGLLGIAKEASRAAKANHEKFTAAPFGGDRLDASTESKLELTMAEIEIRDVFAKLSNVKRSMIGLQTTIFRLGLDSISAVQIAAQLRHKGRKVSPMDVLEHPTIRQLALHLQSKVQVTESRESFDFESYDKRSRREVCFRHGVSKLELESVRPSTPIQSGILAAFLRSKGSMYFNSIEMQVPDGPNDDGKLRKAWGTVTAKYEILRTGFSNVNDPQHPFAMLTYHKDVLDPAFAIIKESSLESIDTLSEQASYIGRAVLKSLFLPPWRLLVLKKPNHWTIRLFILHALFDATSLHLILGDLAKTYRGEILSQAPPIEPLLNSILIESVSNADSKRMFWQDTMKDFSPTKFPNTTTFHVKSTETFSLERTCAMSLLQLQGKCKEMGVTVQSAGQASWARVLSIYTGESAVIFGSVFSGRINLEVTELIPFPSIVTLPICTRVDGSNRELLDKVMRTQSSLLKHQFTPLSKIQRWIGHRDEALFDTLFVYQDTARQVTNDSEPWKVEEETATADYPISIEFHPLYSNEAVLKLRLVARKDTLPREQASILLEQLENTLFDTIFNPNRNSTDTTSYPREVLSITPAKEAYIPCKTTLLHQFVEVQAEHHPYKVALEFATSLAVDESSKRQWTYRELNSEGDKITQLLARNGVKPKKMVAICFRKCPEASFATLGILKAGCAFVAIDPDAPTDRQRFIIQDSDASVVLVMKDTAEALREQTKVPVVALDDVENFLAATKPTKLQRELPQQLQGSDLCYCLYTSGTSGTPKACLITHENAVQAMLSFQRLFHGHWDVDSRFLQFASFHFDVSVLEQYWSWSVGICVTSAPRDLIFEDIAGAISALGITHLDLTPSLAKTLHPDDVPSLCKGVFITGGEQLQQEVLDVWGSKGCIYNGYGPTETTIGNTMFPRVPSDGKPSNIGRQFDNVGTYIFRVGTTSPVLRGAVGELCIAGSLVSPGYLNQPELNKQKFPYLKDYGERVYRTGDLVRILHDGTFDFLGRADDQVKLRGQRLEVAEINEVIKRGVDQVRDVATLGIKHIKSQRMQLVSFFVPSFAKNRRTNLEVLEGNDTCKIALIVKEICQGKLPPYMVPTHFIPVNGIPLSSNNKLESKPLKALYNRLSSAELQNLTTVQGEPQTAWSDLEKRIIGVLARATETDDAAISRNSSIFNLGLDSISVVNFARSLKDAGFANAQISVVMQNPIIGQLSKALAGSPRRLDAQYSAQMLARQNIEAFRLRHFATVCRALRLSGENVEGFAPCTPLQEGIISRALSSDTPLYFEEFCFELSPKTDTNRLKYAWTKVMSSIQVLRTRFHPTVDGYAQIVLKAVQVPWNEEVFVAEDEIKNLKSRRYNSWLAENRELGGRLFEIQILQSKTRRLMCLNIFHALYDGLSLSMILEKTFLEYSRVPNITYGPPFLETLAFGSLCQVEGAKDFWKIRLRGLAYERLQFSTEAQSRATISVTLDISLFSINDVRRRHNTTYQSLIQAAWTVILRKYFPSQTVFGMVVSGRSIDFEAIDQTIGPLFNTIPFIPQIEGCKSWQDVIRCCHEFNTAVLPYQHCSLRDITKWCGRSSEKPLFESLFVFQKDLVDDSLRNQHWTQVETASQADYPLSFEAVLLKNEEMLRLTIIAQAKVSNEENSLKMLEDFSVALSEIVTGSENSPFGATEPLHHVDCKNLGDKNQKRTDRTPETAESVALGWSRDAFAIRDEIALLAECKPSTLDLQSSIFAFGLDSIDAVKLSSRLKRQGINLSVSMIMRNTTIAQMVTLVSNDPKTAQDQTTSIDLDKYEEQLTTSLHESGDLMESIEAILPPTPLQEAMFADMSISSYSRYFNQDILVLEPSTNIEKLKLACISVVCQSPILRTSFVGIDDPRVPVSYAQIIHRPGELCLRSVDMGPEDDLDAIIQTAIKQDRATAMDSVPFKLTFIHGEKATHLTLSLSHALYDGWSLSLLHNDIIDAYHDRFIPRPSYRPTLERILNSSGVEAARYWTNYILGVKGSSFPQRLGEVQPNLQVHRREKISTIPVGSIKSFIRDKGITMQALGQTCWALVLGSYLKSLEVAFGVVLSGRDTEEANQINFPTMNTVVVRSIIHGSTMQMLRHMQDGCANAVQYQHFPLRKVQAAARTDGGKLFDSLFILQRNPGLIEEEKLYKSVGGESSVEFPVCVEMELGDENLLWRIACEDSIFSAEDAESPIQRLESVLGRLLESNADPIVEITQEGTRVCGLPAFQPDQGKVEEFGSIHAPEIALTTEQWTDTEAVIRKILSDVSHVPENEINKQQTIFNLGLDSISAIKVSSLLRKRSLNLGVAKMLKAANIATMASVIDNDMIGIPSIEEDSKNMIVKQLAHLRIEQISKSAGIDLKNVEKTLSCGSGQVYMLSTWQNSGGVLFYPTFHYQTTQTLDEARLRKSWDTLCQKSSILRTAFASTGDWKIPFLQFVLKENSNPVVRLSERPREGQLNTAYNKPPVTLAILPPKPNSAGAEQTSIFLSIHHALYDGVSLDVLIAELQNLYRNPSATIQTEPQFEDFLACGLADSSQKARMAFWSTYLCKGENSLLPLTESIPISTRNFQFKPSLISTTENLIATAKHHGISIQALFFAAYARIHASLLSRRGVAAHDIILGIYLANRSLPLDGLPTRAIPTVNLVPLRIRNALQTPLHESAQAVQRDLHAIGTAENSAVGLWEIFQWTGVKVDCFINFLSLPGDNDDDGVVNDPGELQHQWVQVKQPTEPEPHPPTAAPVHARKQFSRNGAPNVVADVYRDSIDVEAAIRPNGGGLDVGIWFPDCIQGSEELGGMMEGLRAELARLEC